MASKAGTWLKMAAAGAAICVGGPALVFYVTPSEEELLKKMDPETRKIAEAKRLQQEQQFGGYAERMKALSHSDKNIWIAMREDEKRQRLAAKQGRTAKVSPAPEVTGPLTLAEREALEKKGEL